MIGGDNGIRKVSLTRREMQQLIINLHLSPSDKKKSANPPTATAKTRRLWEWIDDDYVGRVWTDKGAVTDNVQEWNISHTQAWKALYQDLNDSGGD
jgi:hypothetical protein